MGLKLKSKVFKNSTLVAHSEGVSEWISSLSVIVIGNFFQMFVIDLQIQ